METDKCVYNLKIDLKRLSRSLAQYNFVWILIVGITKILIIIPAMERIITLFACCMDKVKSLILAIELAPMANTIIEGKSRTMQKQ